MSDTAAPVLAEARLLEAGDGVVVLKVIGTDYRVELVGEAPVGTKTGQRVRGVIRARAQRVDVIQSGGVFIEPVYGRPRRLQGRVVALNPQERTLTVDCCLPFVCTIMDHQSAGEFRTGQMVSFDIEAGASFEGV